MFQSAGKNVAGLMGHMQEGQPTAWATYVSVADADETAQKVKDAGGSVIVDADGRDGPRPYGASSPTPPAPSSASGSPRRSPAPTSSTSPSRSPGTRSTRPTPTRTRPSTTPSSAGTAGKPQFEGAPDTYTVWQLDGNNVGGMMQMVEGMFPPGTPPHWSVCFAVADADATVAKAREHGATVVAEPMDMPIGRFAAVIDPQGAGSRSCSPPPPRSPPGRAARARAPRATAPAPRRRRRRPPRALAAGIGPAIGVPRPSGSMVDLDMLRVCPTTKMSVCSGLAPRPLCRRSSHLDAVHCSSLQPPACMSQICSAR